MSFRPVVYRIQNLFCIERPKAISGGYRKYSRLSNFKTPTGSGKTEAALLWAQKNQNPNGRLFYVLPYTASINAMHRRLSKIFRTENVGLLHHNAMSLSLHHA